MWSGLGDVPDARITHRWDTGTPYNTPIKHCRKFRTRKIVVKCFDKLSRFRIYNVQLVYSEMNSVAILQER